MLARWGEAMGRPPRTRSHLAKLLDAVTARPAVKRAYEAAGNFRAELLIHLGSASRSWSFDHRRRPEMLRTAIATAFFWPTKTTSFLPRVTPV
jgi:hypothetical protein